MITIHTPHEIIHKIISSNHYFPNNTKYPLLIYKKTLDFNQCTTKDVEKFLNNNQWQKTWVDSVYKYHHYHSNTHEALVIFKGSCDIQVGGNNGEIYTVVEGDVIIFPAGVSHKNVNSSADFKCIGSYPCAIEYDMNYGKKGEHPAVDKKIAIVGLPATDPIFGENGKLFDYWK